MRKSQHKSSKSKGKNIIESNLKTVEFSEIIKIELGEKDDEIKFILESGEIITEKIKSCLQFVDPSYDTVFKTIFQEGDILGKIGGSERLLNLLNSLIFPNEKSKSFTEIKSISNERSKMSPNQDNSGILRFDISCRATVTDKGNNSTKIIDVEMQLGKKSDLLSRMSKYANSLYQAYNIETILIAFMNHNYINDQNRTQFSYKIVCNGEGDLIKEEYDTEVMMVNLKEEIEKNQNGKKIFINKKELNEVGISWLKLLGIRQWGLAINNFYYLPKNVHFLTKELESALKILQSYDKGDLLRLLRKEEEDNNALEVHTMSKMLRQLLKLFETKKESFDDMIDIIDFENSSFKIKDIEEIIPEEIKRNEFISLLGKKRKIE